MLFDQTFKNISRVREIANILLKYGFEDFVSNTALKAVIPGKRRLSYKREHVKKKNYSRWELMRMAAEELGPTFIKLAQALSNRPDILPEPLMIEFQKLQSGVPPFPIETVHEIIQRETGKTVDELFSSFREKPIGSASIGQVHLATLRDNGKKVVIKVQRPKVRGKVATDLSIVKEIVKRSEASLESQGMFNAMDIVEAFERNLQNELDYTTEARFMEQFGNYYKKFKNFSVPSVYKSYSTSKILIMEFIEGCEITDVEKLTEWGISPEKIAEQGMDIYLTQIFEHGYFHADPHPGNILVRPDGKICLIDFGMVGKLSKRDRLAFSGVLIGMAQEDPKKMARSFKRLALDSDIEDDRAFEADLGDLIDDFSSLDVSEVQLTEVTNRLQAIIRDYKLRMPGGIFIILRALTILEGIGKTIHPNFKTYEFFKPYGFKLFKEQYSPENILEEVMGTTRQFGTFISGFPTDVKDILEKTRKGKIHFEIGHSGLEPYVNKLSRAISRLSMSIVIMGLLISASILTFANVGAQSNAIYYLSLTGYILAMVFTSMMFFASWWNNR